MVIEFGLPDAAGIVHIFPNGFEVLDPLYRRYRFVCPDYISEHNLFLCAV